jgi:hypothetical protein
MWTDSVIYFTTMRPNYFVPGQSVVVTGPEFTARPTQSPMIGLSLTPLQLQQLRLIVTYPVAIYSSGHSNIERIIGSAAVCIDTHQVENAILVVSVEIFQSITAPGNQIMSDNFQPSTIYSRPQLEQ